MTLLTFQGLRTLDKRNKIFFFLAFEWLNEAFEWSLFKKQKGEQGLTIGEGTWNYFPCISQLVLTHIHDTRDTHTHMGRERKKEEKKEKKKEKEEEEEEGEKRKKEKAWRAQPMLGEAIVEA